MLLSLALGIVLALLLESLGFELNFKLVDSALKFRLKELTELISKLCCYLVSELAALLLLFLTELLICGYLDLSLPSGCFPMRRGICFRDLPVWKPPN